MNNQKFQAKNLYELETYLNKICNDGLCYTVSILFGTCYITGYKSPSKINYNEYGGSYNHQYWRNGQWNDFPLKTIIKYQNTDGQD